MRERGAARLAWLVWGLVMAVLIGAFVLIIWNRGTIDRHFATFYAIYGAAALAYATIGALVSARHPRNPVGWVFCAMSLGFAGMVFCEEYGVRGVLLSPGALPGAEAIAYQADWLPRLAFFPIALVFLLFPSGRPLSPRWRPVTWLALGSLAIMIAVGLFDWEPSAHGLEARFEELGVRVSNPLGIRAAEPVFNVLLVAAGLGMASSFFVSVLALVLRFRRAGGEERQQVRWLAFTGAIFLAFFLLVPFAILYYGREEQSFFAPAFWVGTLLSLSLGVPVASGMAILKYRLYDLDIIVNKTLVYGALTAALGLAYFGIVVVLQQALSPLAGGTDLAVAGSTLSVAALFRPARRRIQAFIDRRFYRRKYDAAKTVEAFTARLRDEIDLDTLRYELTEVVRETMQPAHVSLWLRSAEAAR